MANNEVSLFELIRAGLDEAIAVARGEQPARGWIAEIPDEPDSDAPRFHRQRL